MVKEAANTQDQSMEEILQSIKRIIAEESHDEPEADKGKKIANNNTQAPAKPAPVSVAPASDDVLELTEAVDEDMEPEEMMPEFDAPPAPQPVISSATSFNSRTESILEAVDREPARETHKDVLDDIDTLLSSEAAQASAKALRSLSQPKPQAPAPQPVNPGMPFRSGNTVEDLALEALRPMLKDWLDNNLPGIVERLVEREVRKISGS